MPSTIISTISSLSLLFFITLFAIFFALFLISFSFSFNSNHSPSLQPLCHSYFFSSSFAMQIIIFFEKLKCSLLEDFCRVLNIIVRTSDFVDFNWFQTFLIDCLFFFTTPVPKEDSLFSKPIPDTMTISTSTSKLSSPSKLSNYPPLQNQTTTFW